MITSSNYHTSVKNLDFKSAPDAIQNMHSKFDLMNKYYGKNDGITDALNVYLEKLNKWANTSENKLEVKTKVQPKPKAAKTRKEPKAIKAKPAKQIKLPKPKFEAGDLVKVRLKGWVMVVEKVEEYNKQSKGYRYFIENTTKGTGNGNVGSYWAHELKLYVPMKRKAVKKKVAPRRAAPKAVATKPVKSSKVRTPELVLIRGFMALNKKSISIKSFETKLAATKHLETVNHKPLIDEIKSKLQTAISSAKDDSNCNGRITATISPDFLKKCKETLSNAKELLRVSYIGGV